MSIERSWKRVFLPWSLIFAIVTLGAAIFAASPGGAAPGHGRGAAKAGMARQMSVNLTGHLHVVGQPGQVLIEHGSFTGTVSGPATIHFTMVTSTSGVAAFAFHPEGGSINGRSSTTSHVVGGTVYFRGTLSITSGTGKWVHAKGANLSFSGFFDRRTLDATAHLSGSLHV